MLLWQDFSGLPERLGGGMVINPWHMCEVYGSHSVCECVVCPSITALDATYLVCMSKMGHHRVPCRLLKICIVWTSLKQIVWMWRDLPATMIGDTR